MFVSVNGSSGQTLSDDGTIGEIKYKIKAQLCETQLTASVLRTWLAHVRQADVSVGKANGSLWAVVVLTRASRLARSKLKFSVVQPDTLRQAGRRISFAIPSADRNKVRWAVAGQGRESSLGDAGYAALLLRASNFLGEASADVALDAD